jgi:hypothetical protein
MKELLEEYSLNSGSGSYGRVGSEVQKMLGDVASAFVLAGAASGVVVMQAASLGID